MLGVCDVRLALDLILYMFVLSQVFNNLHMSINSVFWNVNLSDGRYCNFPINSIVCIQHICRIMYIPYIGLLMMENTAKRQYIVSGFRSPWQYR